jgi:valine--pyruvate aminotransferase
MNFSAFGKKFGGKSGITELMEDLGNALNSEADVIMMGGGNPAHVPEVENLLREKLESIIQDESAFRRLIGIYDPPQGELDFIQAICDLLNREFSWDIKPENIALTNGSQSGFFILFNLFAGNFEQGERKQILLPLAPEYIGYSDSGLSSEFFRAYRPEIELIGSQHFKYHVDFSKLEIDDQVGAICVSRPTNPTGNVLTDEEVSKLDKIAREKGVPLILDGAYGTPFPELIYTKATPFWNYNTIVCLSLSKLGLPAARTGIIIASEEVIQAVSGTNAIMSLATGSFGPMLATDMVRSGEILKLSREVVRPFYLQKAKKAEQILLHECRGLPVRLHKIEGAMFLWIWMKGCPVGSQEMYEKLKERGVLVVPGHHFFPGMETGEDTAWEHRNECLRVTYSQDDERVSRGLKIIAQTIREAYQSA